MVMGNGGEVKIKVKRNLIRNVTTGYALVLFDGSMAGNLRQMQDLAQLKNLKLSAFLEPAS